MFEAIKASISFLAMILPNIFRLSFAFKKLDAFSVFDWLRAPGNSQIGVMGVQTGYTQENKGVVPFVSPGVQSCQLVIKLGRPSITNFDQYKQILVQTLTGTVFFSFFLTFLFFFPMSLFFYFFI